ncbi:MAG TPA: Wzz/FepE/Etk N-terminal domain-containing protein, partial [Streptosporangiaceae bacterium]
MKSSEPPAPSTLLGYTGTVRRRRWVVLAGVLVGIVGGLAYAELAPKTYTAVASVYILKTGANQSDEVTGARSGSVIDLDSEAQVVTSAAVASAAGNLMGSPLTPYQLARQINVTVPPNSGILDIACGTGSPAKSASCANAFAKAYLADRSTVAANTINSQIHALKGKITTLDSTIAGLNNQIPTLPANDLTRLSDDAKVRSDRTAINAFSRQISTLTGQAANVTGGRIITTASRPGSPTDPSRTLVLPSGLTAGLILGLLGAFIAERRDKKLRSTEDVERLLDVPVMLDLSRNSFGRQVSLAAPRSRMGKAFTELAHSVAVSLGEGSHVLLVAGTSAGPEASVVAANLAATLARTHSEAVLVCADLHDSVATELFG